MPLVQEYTRWFERNYGSCLCRQRSGVNFYAPGGQIRYLFPGDKTARCLWHIRGAARYVHALKDRPLRALAESENSETMPAVHCAGEVLRKIEEKTGLVDDTLKRVAFIFDGGLGFSGGVCGALAGAILGINLKLGVDVRGASYFKTVRDFVAGHMNLLRDKPPEEAEPFSVGKTIVSRFKEAAGSIECAEITGRAFSGYTEFRPFITTAETCHDLMDKAAQYAINAIEE